MRGPGDLMKMTASPRTLHTAWDAVSPALCLLPVGWSVQESMPYVPVTALTETVHS